MTHFQPSITRRQFNRFLVSGSLAIAAGGLATLGAIEPAAAGRAWCKMDPDFRINGHKLHVYLSGPIELHDTVTGPSKVTLYLPSTGVDAEFLWADEGFGGLGYTVQILTSKSLVVDPTSGAIPFQVKTFVPCRLQTELEAQAVHEKQSLKTVTDTKKGTTNASVLVAGKLK